MDIIPNNEMSKIVPDHEDLERAYRFFPRESWEGVNEVVYLGIVEHNRTYLPKTRKEA
jgi:hypothetical protein